MKPPKQSGAQNRLRMKISLAEQQNWKCCYCGIVMEMNVSDQAANKATIEHILPRAHRGKGNIGNLVIACYPCNAKRGKAMRPIHHEALNL